MSVVKVNFNGVPKRERQAATSARTWSAQQDAIFDWSSHGTGNLVVRARAGTGKSTSIREMVERAPEQKILILAFNKSIARDMQGRVSNPRVEVKTCHGLGLRFVSYAWGRQVKIAEGDARSMPLAKRACGANASERVLRLVRDLHTKTRELKPFATRDDIEGVALRFDLAPDESMEEEGWGFAKVVEAAHRAMKFAAERTDLIDFADMIFLPLVNRLVRPWYNMVLVDEAQDMTEAQLALAVGACKRGGRVAIVGDDRQAIYAFRGADSGSLDRLKQELRATELGLTGTYRCGRVIVELARELVPDFVACSTHEGEIVKRTDEAMLDEAREGDFVLSRTNAPLVRVCMALLKRGVRAKIKGRDIGRGIVAMLKKLRAGTVAEIPSLLAKRTADEVAKAQTISDDKLRGERVDFLQDQQAIVLALLEGAATLPELYARCEDLFSDDAEKQAVMCSSVHRAKGLEANRVYLLEGTFRRGGEEDNIRYVAITRAITTLAWVSGFGKE